MGTRVDSGFNTNCVDNKSIKKGQASNTDFVGSLFVVRGYSGSAHKVKLFLH